MNKEWSTLNKTMQSLIGKQDTFREGLSALITLRNDITDTLKSFREELTDEEFSAQPYPKSEGYHSKTVAYSLWHIFRIEDITAHRLMA